MAYRGKIQQYLKTRTAEDRCNRCLDDQLKPFVIHFNLGKHNLSYLGLIYWYWTRYQENEVTTLKWLLPFLYILHIYFGLKTFVIIHLFVYLFICLYNVCAYCLFYSYTGKCVLTLPTFSFKMHKNLVLCFLLDSIWVNVHMHFKSLLSDWNNNLSF